MMSSKSSQLIVLEKIAKELEIANKLKMLEIVFSQAQMSTEYYEKMYNKSKLLEKIIKQEIK